MPYSNAKLEATNKLIKDIKRQAFSFRNFENFKTKIFIALNIRRKKSHLKLSRCWENSWGKDGKKPDSDRRWSTLDCEYRTWSYNKSNSTDEGSPIRISQIYP